MTGTDAVVAGSAGLTVEDLKLSLIRLDSWPDLSFVRESSQVRVARICALLSRKPTVGHLIPRVLGESDEVVLAEVLNLVKVGHVHVVGAGMPQQGAGEFAPATQSAPLDQLAGAVQPKRSLIGKLWAKLGF